MIVKQILAQKSGDAPVVTIAPAATLVEAAALLTERRIGAVVVSDDGAQPVGILSERDIVRAVAQHGAPALTRSVAETMTRNVKTCQTGDHVRDVLGRMTEGRFRHLPVIDDSGAMIGIISIGDAVSARLKQLASDREALQGMIMGN